MEFDIDTLGFEKLDKALKQLEPRVQKRVLQGAATSAIREGRKQIKAAAPKGAEQSENSKEYGRITQNLKVKRLKRVGRSEKAARVDTGDAFWAVFYELGTSRQPARPFMKRAFRQAVPAMLTKLAERLNKGIAREVEKLK